MDKKVTILIPVYNGSNYLKEAIESALAQTYKNKEIIVVNDGSTDNGKTKEIALSYKDKIKYYEKENGGAPTALNYGIERMTGDYLSWLSHDDLYYPNKVERQIEEIKKYDENTILFSDFDLIDENGVKFDTVYCNHDMLMQKPDYAVLRGAIGGITLLIPKKALDDCGKFNKELRCTQDYDMWFRMIQKGYKFVHMQEVLTMTRIHRNQDTNTSPRVTIEGNILWQNMTNDYPLEKKIEYEGTEYLFYEEMANHLRVSPYKEAVENISKIAESKLDAEKSKAKKTSICVVVVSNNNEDDLTLTIKSLKKQTCSNIKIIVEGTTKNKDLKVLKTREEILKGIKEDYYTFLNAGVEVASDWLEQQIAIAIATKKALVISDFPRKNRGKVTDNYTTLVTTIEGILFNSKYQAEYTNLYEYLYKIAKQGGIYTTEKKYINNQKEKYDINNLYKLVSLVTADNSIDKLQKAEMCYDVSVIFNKENASGNKVYMYEPCNNLKELMFSRSFRMLKKYMSIMHNLKEKIKSKRKK